MDVQTVKDIISSAEAVESKAYRDAMSHYAGAVQLVTTAGPTGRRGLTLTAACSVSDNPPTVLVCLQKMHPENRLFIENGVFAVNTLAAAHQHLADAFSGRIGLTQDERFALTKWSALATGAPVLPDALACFDCRVVSVQDHSTHHVLFGEVVGMSAGGGQQALVYLNRRYHTLDF